MIRADELLASGRTQSENHIAQRLAAEDKLARLKRVGWDLAKAVNRQEGVRDAIYDWEIAAGPRT